MEELKRKIERLSRQSAQMLTQLALSDLQLRALNMGQDRFRRRLWILPHAGGVYYEALESAEANAGKLGTWDGKGLPPIKKARWDETDDGVGSVGSFGDENNMPADCARPQPESQPEQSQPGMQPDQPLLETQPDSTVKAEPADDKADRGSVKTEPDAESDDAKPLDAVPLGIKTEHENAAADVASLPDLPTLWFNLLPRIPCDHHSLVHANESLSNGLSSEPTVEGEADGVKDEPYKEEAEKSEIQPIPEGKGRNQRRQRNRNVCC